MIAAHKERPMKKVQRFRTRRQLLRLTSVGAATFPFFALAKKTAWAQSNNNNNNNNNIPSGTAIMELAAF
jgi:hypothetical protein